MMLGRSLQVILCDRRYLSYFLVIFLYSFNEAKLTEMPFLTSPGVNTFLAFYVLFNLDI